MIPPDIFPLNQPFVHFDICPYREARFQIRGQIFVAVEIRCSDASGLIIHKIDNTPLEEKICYLIDKIDTLRQHVENIPPSVCIIL